MRSGGTRLSSRRNHAGIPGAQNCDAVVDISGQKAGSGRVANITRSKPQTQENISGRIRQ
jgi:hypothetical protein